MRYTVKRLDEFANWLIGLKDPVTRQRLNKRLAQVVTRQPG
jgi:putative component of toxin-antitoxin plasmid stabilization module